MDKPINEQDGEQEYPAADRKRESEDVPDSFIYNGSVEIDGHEPHDFLGGIMIFEDRAISGKKVDTVIGIYFGIDGVLVLHQHVFTGGVKIKRITGLITALLDILVGGQDFTVQGKDENLLKKRLVVHRPV
ncbi:hypothetical protein D1872_281660 [compost metagenome]